MTDSPQFLIPKPQDFLNHMPRYIGGRAALDTTTAPDKIYKLSANENPLGASKHAITAYKQAHDFAQYPDGSARKLREAIATFHKINPEQIICGNGSGELLHLLAQGYLGAGESAIHTIHGFLIYEIAIRMETAQPIAVAERDFTTDIDAIRTAITPQTKMVFLANPNNPTGTMLTRDEILHLHAQLRGDIVLVLDMAYAEYAPQSIAFDGFDLVDAHQNIVITRSFSKIYGLAGLRLGWAYCPSSIADTLTKLRAPFNVNSAAQKAGIAAINDQAHIARSQAHNAQWRDWLMQQLGGLGIRLIPSHGNFILMLFDNPAMARAAEKFCWTYGVILRGLDAYKIPHGLRLSIGSEEANRATHAALTKFMRQF